MDINTLNELLNGLLDLSSLSVFLDVTIIQLQLLRTLI